MALIPISETQLVFGYFHSYMNVKKPKKFLFPSIRQEGGRVKFKYPGADVIINNNHLIQFKRPYFFTTNGIKEFGNYQKPNDINAPLYRIYIKNDNPTNQLDKLVQATQQGIKAEYISPLFNDDTTFFNLLKNDKKHLRSYAHIDIGQFRGMLATIGKNNDHTILYNQDSVDNGFCYCFSEPKKISVQKLNLEYESQDRENSFLAIDIIKIINALFFEEDNVSTPKENLLQQCNRIQRRLFIEQNIIWYFNYTIL